MSGTRVPSVRPLWFVAATALVALFALLAPGKAHAQLDTRHWIPPLWAVLNDGNVDDHYVTVSTPEVSPVAFTLKDGAGNTYTGTVSNSAPVTLQIGNYSGGYAAYTSGGWSGTHTAHVRCGVAALNTVNSDGLIVESERPVYVSIRQKSGSQGEVVASPGRKGLGTEFRAIFARNDKTTMTVRGSFISVMATQPGTTTITFDGIKSGVRFYGKAATSGTTDAFTITLNQYESYVIGQQDSDTTYPFTAPLADLNGTRITSDQLIAATSGFWLGGPVTSGGQDIGVDQLVPVETAGTLFVLIKGNAAASNLMETITVVATQNDTNIYVGGSATPLNATPLAAGGYYFVNNQYVGDGLYMTTSKPVMVVQEIGGSDSYATPGANVIPPLGADAANSVDNIPNVAWVGTATIGIVTRTGANLLVNGAAPSVSPQSITGTTEWVTYKINGLTGDVSVVSNAAVAVSLINVSGAIGSAGYFSGFPSSPTVDLDGDNTPDGGDNCPDDPNLDQIDDDGDGVGNLCDGCDSDPLKAIPGNCGCGIPDTDFDGDGIICTDNCPYISNPTQTDSDSDGIGDACADDLDNDGTPNASDECPLDPNKIVVGYCGCDFAETDSDLDGMPNCVDSCPVDPNKIAGGECGCGVADTDTDGDSFADCVDHCGNAALDVDEGCDDGNLVNTDTCTTQCQLRPTGTADSPTVAEDSVTVIDVQANDATPAVRTVATVIASAPSHGTATVGVDNKVTYTPTAGYNGSDAFTYKLTDEVSQSDAITVSITVTSVNDAPTLSTVTTLTGATEDTAFTISYATLAAAANEADPDGTTPSFRVEAVTAGTLTKGGSAVVGGVTTLGSGESLVWTPAANANGNALNAFTVVAWDGALASSPAVQVKVDVAAANDAPSLAVTDNPNSVSFNGTSAYLGTTNSLLNGRSTYTVSFWINPARLTGAQSLVGQNDAFEIFLQNGTQLRFWNAVSGGLDFDLSADLAVGTWTHIGITGNSNVGANGEVKVYVNGVLKQTQTHAAQANYGSSSGVVNAAGFVADSNTAHYFQGQMDEISIWNVVKSEGEVATLQTLKLNGAESGLLAYWALDEGSGTTGANGVAGAAASTNFAFAGSPGPTWSTSSLGSTATYTENGSPVKLKAWLSLTDVDSATLASGTVALTAGLATGDTLAFTNDGATMGNIAAAYDAGTGTLSLTSAGATATLAQWLSALNVITFASTSETPGSDRTVSWAVNDGALGSAPQTSAIVVTSVNDVPTLGTITTLTGGTEDSAYTVTYATLAAAANEADLEGDALSFRVEAVTSGTLTKGGAAVTPGTTLLGPGEQFVWTPAANANGTLPAFTVRAWDGSAASASAVQVSVSVAAVNDSPAATVPASFALTEDTQGDLRLTGTPFVDVDSASLTVTLSVADGTLAAASGAGVTVGGTATTRTFVGSPASLNTYFTLASTILYTPLANNTSARTLTVDVTDGIAPIQRTATITFTAVNDAPVAVADTIAVAEGGAETVLAGGATSVLGNDTDVEGSALTAVLVTGVGHGTLTLNANGTFSYTHDGSETTSDSFTYRASDAIANSNIVTVAITITAVNDAPQAVADALAVAEGGTATVLTGGAASVLSNDTDADGDGLAAVLVTGVAHGTLTLNANGTFSYTHDGSETTTDSFTYKANDGATNSGAVTVAITVNAVNDAPVAVADNFAVAEGGTETVLTGGATSVLGNDTDAEGSVLNAVLVTGVAHGTLTLNASGTFSYTHDGSETTSDSFTYKANDGASNSGAVTVTITVNPVNDAPVAVADNFAVAEGGTESVLTGGATSVLGNDTDVEGSALNAVLVTSVAHGTLTMNANGTFSYTHDGSETTTDSFTYKANDGAASSGTVTVAITVTAVNDAPTVSAPATFTVTEDLASNLQFTGTPFADSDSSVTVTLSVTDGILAATSSGGVTVAGTATARTFTGTPAALNAYFATAGAITYTTVSNDTGSRPLTVAITDGVLSASAASTINVTAVNDAPTLTTIATLTGAAEDTAFTITHGALAAAANDADIENDTIAFRIESVTSGNLTKNGTAVTPGTTLVAAGDSLVWLPAADAFGTLNAFTVKAWDGALASAGAVQVKVFAISCRDGLLNGGETATDCGGSVCDGCADGLACAANGDCTSGVCNPANHLCETPTCTDLHQNGAETGVDCGGADCPACATGGGCAVASDCVSGVCHATTHQCVGASCSDGVKNGTETALDCGGASCAPCGSGAACALATDCASGICKADHTCQVPSCNDGVKNDRETGVDCGGGTCVACGAGGGCTLASDCASGVCGADHLCVERTCTDGVQNGLETAVDCGGGGECARCDTGDHCAGASDCASGVCAGAVGAMACVAATCTDHVKNGSESGVDCGAASGCGLCDDGAGCGAADDCTSGVCTGGKCQVPSCTDGVLNGLESGVDCGGASGCGPCGDGLGCGSAGDCQSGVCVAETQRCASATCGDGVRNGSETGVDCGGACDADCEDGAGCSAAADCLSGVCDADAHLCTAANCADGVQNGDETDVDCGGEACEACEDGAGCLGASDCASDVCADDLCVAPTCLDEVRNGDESDIDCGGACQACVDGGGCASGDDCASGVCSGGACQAPSCDDAVQNGAETGVDCGGGSCGACGDGSDCVGASDCESGVCTLEICQAALCSDAIQNGGETGVDCGGTCTGCVDGGACTVGSDCASQVCDSGICQIPTCTDGARNGHESGPDCGGTCEACGDGIGCETGADCASGVCRGGICQAPTCDDDVRNGSESDTDCGGSCVPCADLQACAAAGDCASGVCQDAVCQAPGCADEVQNGGESDVDCGGLCAACVDGATCGTAGDCGSSVCVGGECQVPTCVDGAKNGGETDRDCGGPCPDCADGGACAAAGDCTSGVCTSGVCAAPTCADGARNGGESDTDCGGTCAACGDGSACGGATDCGSSVCLSGTCRTAACDDGVRNGSESDVDCGGTCGACHNGDTCKGTGDCTSGVCTDGVCRAPTCSDGAKNAGESDVDCGGACVECVAGATCAMGGDCLSGVCTGGVCQAPTCSDGVMNGAESGADCGGTCSGCADGGACGVDADCASGVCGHGLCQIPSCTDGVANGKETGRDCGGSCKGCADGGACAAASDCASGVCSGEVCQPGTCDDEIHNGAETGVDCGGDCAACADGVGCVDAGDCASGVCTAGVCQVPGCADQVANGAESDVDCGGGCAPCGDAGACAKGSDCASGVCSAGVCRAAACGDGVVNGGESCDDGTLAGIVPAVPGGGDGCSATCEVEAGWSCEADREGGADGAGEGGASVCVTTCGDGELGAPDEACDDANGADGDGCSVTCEVEAGWACSQVAGEASTCSETCGDGALDAATEACDDGNASADDGCSARCTIESGWACAGTPSTCSETDGDGDGVLDRADNCPASANADQANSDADLMGDVCDDDRDGDTYPNADDNCPDAVNPAQVDLDADGEGDTCDDDRDGDEIDDAVEVVNGTDPAKSDTDGDGVDDGVEVASGTDPKAADTDGDGFGDGVEAAVGTDPLDPLSHPGPMFEVSGAGGCAGGEGAQGLVWLALAGVALMAGRRKARR